MKSFFSKNKLKLFFIIYIIFVTFQKSYIWWYPTLSFLYPNSVEESKIVKKIRDEHDDESYLSNLFVWTDLSVVHAFMDVIPEPVSDINNVALSENPRISLYKYLINRPRPAQVNKDIKVRHSVTADTPAYPSGHTYQAFVVAREYSKKYPHLREKLFNIAEQCGQARIAAGLHYPSDHEFSKRLVLKNS